MFGHPSLRFVSQHRGQLVYLPLRRRKNGDVAPQEYCTTSPCGWRREASTSVTVVDAEHPDYVQKAWLASQEKD